MCPCKLPPCENDNKPNILPHVARNTKAAFISTLATAAIPELIAPGANVSAGNGDAVKIVEISSAQLSGLFPGPAVLAISNFTWHETSILRRLEGRETLPVLSSSNPIKEFVASHMVSLDAGAPILFTSKSG